MPKFTRFLGGPNRPKICVGRTKPDFEDWVCTIHGGPHIPHFLTGLSVKQWQTRPTIAFHSILTKRGGKTEMIWWWRGLKRIDVGSFLICTFLLRLHSRRQSKLDEFIGAFTFYAALTDKNFTVRCRRCHGYNFFLRAVKENTKMDSGIFTIQWHIYFAMLRSQWGVKNQSLIFWGTSQGFEA